MLRLAQISQIDTVLTDIFIYLRKILLFPPEMVVSVDNAVKTILAVPRPTHRVVRVVFLEPDHDQDDDNENE